MNSIPEEKVGDWADHCRAAAKMLDAGESVLATALRLKFCSAQYFATVFKAEMGVSPRNWRDR